MIDAWLEAIRKEHINFSQREIKGYVVGTIERLYEASANLCSILESRALQAEAVIPTPQEQKAEPQSAKRQTYYLYAPPSGQAELSSNGVFYKVRGEQLANTLCRLFSKEYTSESSRPCFFVKCADEVQQDEQVLLNEALDWLEVYDEPDRTAYDSPPSKKVTALAEYARRARSWEGIILARTGHETNSSIDESADQSSSNAARGTAARASSNTENLQLDRHLIAPKLRDLADEMHKRIVDGERLIQFEVSQVRNEAGYLPRFFEFHKQLTDEWVSKAYAAYCEACKERNRSVSPGFIRWVRGKAIRMIETRRLTVLCQVRRRAVGRGQQLEKVSVDAWNAMMGRLSTTWSGKLEADAVACQYRTAKDQQASRHPLPEHKAQPQNAKPTGYQGLPSATIIGADINEFVAWDGATYVLRPTKESVLADERLKLIGSGRELSRIRRFSPGYVTFRPDPSQEAPCPHCAPQDPPQPQSPTQAPSLAQLASPEERALVPNHLTGSAVEQFFKELLATKALIKAEAEKIWNGCSNAHRRISVAANDEKRRVFSEQYERWRDQLIGLQETLIVDRLLPLVAKYQIVANEQKWLLQTCHEVWRPVTAGYLDWLTFAVLGHVHGIATVAIPEWAWQLPGGPRDVARLDLTAEKKASTHFRGLVDTLQRDLALYREGAIAKAFLMRNTNESPIVDSGMRVLEPEADHGPVTIQADGGNRSLVGLPRTHSAPLSVFEATVGKLMVQARKEWPTKYLPLSEISKIATLLDDQNLPLRDNLEHAAARTVAEHNKQHPRAAIKTWQTALSYPGFRRAVRKRFWRAEDKYKKATPSIADPSAGTPRTTI